MLFEVEALKALQVSEEGPQIGNLLDIMANGMKALSRILSPRRR
jgi:hypothetical protein